MGPNLSSSCVGHTPYQPGFMNPGSTLPPLGFPFRGDQAQRPLENLQPLSSGICLSTKPHKKTAETPGLETTMIENG